MHRTSDRRAAADSRTVQAAMAAYAQTGFAGLEKHLPELREVLARAPASYPRVEEQGGILVLRGEDPRAVGLKAQSETSDGRKLPARLELNTYPIAALLLGSYAVEKRRPAESLAPLDRGLAMQPDNAMLVTEKATALGQLARWQEAADLVSAWLAANPGGDPLDRARMLRSKGFSFIELKRLDEAEGAFRDSLKLEPGHALARNELEYIRRLRAGGPQKPTGLITSNRAATDEPIPD